MTAHTAYSDSLISHQKRWATSGPCATNPHCWDALEGRSFWPEVWCGFLAPWYMISRVYKKLGYPYPLLVLLLAICVWIPSGSSLLWGSVSEVSEGKMAVPISAIVFGIVCQAALLAAICWLRNRVRVKYGLEGTICGDIASSCFCSCFELASIDRQLDVSPSMPHDAVHTPNTSRRDRWSASLCGWDMSLLGKWPEFLCALTQPWFMQTRLLHRIGRYSLLRVVLLAVLEISVPVTFLTLSAETESILLKVLFTALSGLFTSMNVVANAYGVWLRYTVREKIGIYGTVSDDCCVTICCSSCALVQMDQETEPLHPSTGADKDEPVYQTQSNILI